MPPSIPDSVFRCWKNGHNAAQAHRQLCSEFGNNFVSPQHVRKLVASFNKNNFNSLSIEPELLESQILENSNPEFHLFNESALNQIIETSVEMSPNNVPTLNTNVNQCSTESNEQQQQSFSSSTLMDSLEINNFVENLELNKSGQSLHETEQLEQNFTDEFENYDNQSVSSETTIIDINLTLEQKRCILLHCFLEKKSPTKALKHLDKIYGETMFTLSFIHRWYHRFRSGRFELNDQKRKGRPQKLENKKLIQFIEETPLALSSDIAEKFKVTVQSIYKRMKKLGYSLKMDQWVPYAISDKNKAKRKRISLELKEKVKNENVLPYLLTCDEKMVHFDNSIAIRHWRKKGKLEGEKLKSPKPSIHGRKVMILVFWDKAGVVYLEFLPAGKTINAIYYCQVLDRVKNALWMNRPTMRNQRVYFQQDNASPHVAKITKKKLKQLGWDILPHPPYSPDLAPSDYHLFRDMTIQLKGKKFTSLDEVKQFIKKYLFFDLTHKFYDDKTFYQKGIYDLIKRWDKCINANGDYF